MGSKDSNRRACGGERAPRVGIYGVTNVGKSSLLNRITGQQAAVVSPVAGTTTDPVRRVFEVTGYGPVIFIDTAGIDDEGSEVGRLRVAKTWQTLSEVDLAVVLLADARPSGAERRLLDRIRANDVPYLLLPSRAADLSAAEVLRRICAAIPVEADAMPPFFGERAIAAGEVILLVCPIDAGAPAGRLILPQVQALRAALELGAVAIVVQPEQLGEALRLHAPRLVVTDSQAFREVTTLVRERCPEAEVTSFSVLLAEQKGDAAVYGAGLAAVDGLKAGDRVLVIENCSHQVTCDDIGRTKIPGWLRAYTGIESLEFTFVSGRDPLPESLSDYALAVQCGGCVATRRMVQARIRAAVRSGVPITNYGMLIRKLRGVSF
ncbi:GTPase [uncultured Rikenella sp.]|uniref:GTPase n=1 Tax=uncultured Rikenella sp. TaxID=368003 RepID=UPI00262C288E|nr:GTPase [uncultured Rikenella sp.]